MKEITLSKLGKTWLIDIDGTILKHAGYKIDGEDSVLESSKKFLDQISTEDIIILLTARDLKLKEQTEEFLNKNGIKYNLIVYNLPFGERIVINDIKPSGLKTAISINVDRDMGINYSIIEENI